jgi:hypothetical protein
VKKFTKFLENLFGSKLREKNWLALPKLQPKQHFYPPLVKKVPPPAAYPLVLGEALKKLEEDYFQFSSLLQSHRESFLRTKEWKDSDSELFTSSSDSEQQFEVEELLGKKIVDCQVYYKVKWKYYPETEWIRLELLNCSDLLENFELTLKPK